MKITTTLTPRNAPAGTVGTVLQLVTLLSRPGAPGIGVSQQTLENIEDILATSHTSGSDNQDLSGLIPKSTATTAGDWLYATAAATWVRKTTAEVKSLLGLGSAAYVEASTLVPVQSGHINGQYDVVNSPTITNGSITDINYALGAYYLDISALTSAHAFTLTASNWSDSAYYSAMTLIIKAGATLPTITWPAGWTIVDVPTVSKTNKYVADKLIAASVRVELSGTPY